MQGIRNKLELPVLLQAIGGFALLTLIMFGAAATVYKLIAPGGWLAQFFGGGMPVLAAAMIGLLVISAIGSLSRAWLADPKRAHLSGWLVYALGAAGLLYALQFVFG